MMVLGRGRWVFVRARYPCNDRQHVLQVDPGLSLIKGGGGALLREKMVRTLQPKAVKESFYSPSGSHKTPALKWVKFAVS